MKKLRLSSIAVVVLAIILLAGCHKDPVRNPSTESNASFVDYQKAANIAARISPDNIFNLSKPDANNAIEGGITVKDNQNNPACYIFSLKDTGFIIISADRNLIPLLAYSTTSKFRQTDKAPAGVSNWLAKTKEAVGIVRKGWYNNSSQASRQWEYVDRRLKNSTEGSTARAAIKPPPGEDPCETITYHEVLPLVPVTWGQFCGYNELCPSFDDGHCGHAPTGGVATAMAQVMAYHKYPYTYDWTDLPTDHGNYEIARLMRDAGYSVYTQYGAYSSAAYISYVDNALRNTFGYNAIHNYYNETAVINNIGMDRPVILFGVDAGGMGHTWVCDGYWMQTNPCMTTTYMHMNWGLHEYNGADDYNGYFWSANWTINSPGGSYNFQYYKEDIIDIRPL